MKNENLVNAYVLPNLLYELMFLQDEYGIDVPDQDWTNPATIDAVIRRFVLSRFESFSSGTKDVIRNTLQYLLVNEGPESEIWETIWQASSAPIPTPDGERAFFLRCYKALFGDVLPKAPLMSSFHVNHSMQVANRLN
ncbi:hypothetical protein [Caenimonas sp. SL110]|uniref:hypothetical protein n=1 Tax=Caenimonas sp. SL110 TaxID=1450524 RepID=UPI0006548D6B|nr:hypothetical protein [Caenimonas sp. SL110]